MKKKILSMLLFMCVFLETFTALSFVDAAETISIGDVFCPINNLNFISNEYRKRYIENMLSHYISSDDRIEQSLSKGNTAMFLFEGGSDNMEDKKLTSDLSMYRSFAVCIVVKRIDNVDTVIYVNENCSSLPDRPHDYTISGHSTDGWGAGTAKDGTYEAYTVHHKGYAALQLRLNNIAQIPMLYFSSQSDYHEITTTGINVHTRWSSTNNYKDKSGWSWSEGCMLIGAYENGTFDTYNRFLEIIKPNGSILTPSTIKNSSGKYINSSYVYESEIGIMAGTFTIDRQLFSEYMNSIYKNNEAVKRILHNSTEASVAAKNRTPQIIYPAVDETNVPYDTFTMKWSAVQDADSYRVSVRDVTGGVDGEKPFCDLIAYTNSVEIPYLTLSESRTYRAYVEAIVGEKVIPCEMPYPTFTTCAKPKLWLDYTSINCGGSIKFGVESSDNLKNDLVIYRNNGKLVKSVLNMSNYEEFSMTFNEAGSYYAFFTAGDGNGMVDSDRVYFTVGDVAEPSYESKTYDCGTITIPIEDLGEGMNYTSYILPDGYSIDNIDGVCVESFDYYEAGEIINCGVNQRRGQLYYTLCAWGAGEFIVKLKCNVLAEDGSVLGNDYFVQKVIVTDDSSTEADFTVALQDITMSYIGETTVISPIITGNYIGDDYSTWVSSNTKVITVESDGISGVVTAVGEGESILTVTIGGVSASCTVYVENPQPVEPTIPTYHGGDIVVEYSSEKKNAEISFEEFPINPNYTILSYSQDNDKIGIEDMGIGNDSITYKYITVSSGSFETLISVVIGDENGTEIANLTWRIMCVGHTGFSGGNGTKENPYLIANEEQLSLISSGEENQIKYYRLISDIYLQSDWVPVGENGVDTSYINFDGNGHSIFGVYANNEKLYNLELNGIDVTDDFGLFPLLNYSTIENLTIYGEIAVDEDVTPEGYGYGFVNLGLIAGSLHSSSITNCVTYGKLIDISGIDNVGGIAGDAIFDSVIKNCTNFAEISGTYDVGGIAGMVGSNSVIKNCTNAAVISGSSVGGITGSGVMASVLNCTNTADTSGGSVGGIVGFSSMLTIERCYNSGSVSGGNYAGGITSHIYNRNVIIKDCYNTGTISGVCCVGGISAEILSKGIGSVIENCYNTGTIFSEQYAGGIVCNSYGTRWATVKNAYYLDGCVSFTLDSEYDDSACARTEFELKQQSTFVGFDFDNIWAMDANINNGYPYLRKSDDDAYESTLYNLTVTPDSSTAGKSYRFKIEADELPENAFLQFDNPSTGDWFDENYAATAWAFKWEECTVTSDGFTLVKDMILNTVGNADNDYKRKVRVVHHTSDGAKRVSDTVTFVVMPNNEIAPEIGIKDVTYASYENTTGIYITTTGTTNKVKIECNGKQLYVLDSGYTTLDSGDKLWEIHKPTEYLNNKTLTISAGHNMYGYSDQTKEITIECDTLGYLGFPEITSPSHGTEHKLNTALTINWRALDILPDKYDIIIISNDEQVYYTDSIDISATTFTIPSDAFKNYGGYTILLTAYKDGYMQSVGETSVYIPFDETPIPPGSDIGSVANGVNPSYQQIYNYICKAAKQHTEVYSAEFLRACCAMVWQESKWIQFDKNGNVFAHNNKNGSVDYGICQLNSDYTDEAVLARAIVDWQYNLDIGIKKYATEYRKYMPGGDYYHHAQSMQASGKHSVAEIRARSAYCIYNAGYETGTSRRWIDKKDPADVGFYDGYLHKRWEDKINESIDYEAEDALNKEGIISNSKQKPINAKAEPSIISSTVGTFANGSTVNVVEQGNKWVKVEGRDYETGNMITGYVKEAFVSYDNTPTTKPSSFICTVNKKSVYHGDEVIFTVNASYGAKDFTITYDGVITQNISMNYADGVYNYEKIMTGTGERNAVISWTEPDGSNAKATSPTVAVYLNKSHWTGKYIDGVLTLEQTKQLQNDSNSYGLYIKLGNDFKYGGYPVSDTIDSSNRIYERNSSNLLYRIWDNAKNLYLKSGTYEYGIVTKTAYGTVCSHTPIGEFTVEYSDTEDSVKYEPRYVSSKYGANVYNAFGASEPTGKKTWLDEGTRVNYEVGSDIGNDGEYVKVFFKDTTGTERVGWVSRMSLTKTPKYVHPYPDFVPTVWPVRAKNEKDRFNGVYYYNGTGVHATNKHCLDVYHGGLEYAGTSNYDPEQYGQPVVSIAGNGSVYDFIYNRTENTYHSGGGGGNQIIIDYTSTDGNVYRIKYHHLKANSIPERLKERGAPVNADDIIGTVGNTGNSECAHLHMECIKNPGPSAEYINPIDLFAFNSNFIDENGNRTFITSMNKTNTFNGNGKVGHHYNCYFDQNGNWWNAKCGGGTCGHTPQTAGFSLFTLDGSTTDSVNYSIDCYDRVEKFSNLMGTNEGEVSISVPSKTESINVHIPIDETSQFVTIYHAGKGYENDSRLSFDTTTMKFTAIVKDLVGESEYEFDFVITKEAEKSTSVNYAMVTYYNANDEYVGSDIIDFDNVTEGVAPYSTAYVKFENPRKDTVTLKVATEADYEIGTWLPSNLSHSFTEDSRKFMLSINGNDENTIAYTINRGTKSSDSTLQNITVEVYNEESEYFATKAYMAEDEVISMDLPYSTKYIKLYVEATSQFANAEVIVNGEAVSADNLISVSDLGDINIAVTAEDSSTTEYDLNINVAETEDTTAPVISVVGESGTIYMSGNEINEQVIYSATDESWCDIYLSLNGEDIDDMGGISENGEYTLTAIDIFGNKTEFMFTYKNYDYNIDITEAECLDNVVNLSIITDNTTGMAKNATLFMAAYNSDGKLLALQFDDTFTLDSGKVTKEKHFDCSAVKENDFIIKVFVWEGVQSIKPLTNVAQTTVLK